MKTIAFAFILCALATGMATSQIPVMGAEASPNPANVGQTITMTWEATQTVALVSGCGFVDVRQGSPNGPVVYGAGPIMCPFLQPFAGPGFPHTWQWSGNDDTGNPVPPGTYYIRTLYNDPVTWTPFPEHFTPVRIVDPAAAVALPVLDTIGTAVTGQPLPLTIDVPNEPFGTYILGASLTTHVGLTISTTQHLALDPDILWDLSVLTQNPALFAGTIGTLDMNGFTNAPTMFMPGIPALVGSQVAFHGVVIGSCGLCLTNPITRIIH